MANNSRYIRLTKSAVETMFDRCNELYFYNKVERPIKFETWTPYRKTLGMVRPVWSRRNQRTNAIMHISSRYRWTEENLRHVVVHEMIHLAIGDYKEFLTFWQRLPLIGRWFIREHGPEFIDMMNDINSRYGLGIKVKFKEMRKEFIG